MPIRHYVYLFIGGVFLMNALPHLFNGVSGKPFQTPFAKPPGEGLSSSTVNVLWGVVNLVIAYLLLVCLGAIQLDRSLDAIATGLGALVIALFCARHFSRFHGGTLPGSQ